MTSGWRRILARLSQMDWDELKTRGEQEFYKRFDLAQYRIGLPRLSDGVASRSRWGTFFFSADQIPSRVSLLQNTFQRMLNRLSKKPMTYAVTGSACWGTRILIMGRKLIGIAMLCTENVRR